MARTGKWRGGIGGLYRRLGLGSRRARAQAPSAAAHRAMELERLEPRVLLSGAAPQPLLLTINPNIAALVVTQPTTQKAAIADIQGDQYVAVVENSSTAAGIDDPTTDNAPNQAATESGVDILITKLDPAGQVLWSKSLIGQSADALAGIAVDANENLYVIGSGPGSLGAAAGGNSAVTNTANDDVVIEYDHMGNAQLLSASVNQAVGQGVNLVLDARGGATTQDFVIDGPMIAMTAADNLSGVLGAVCATLTSNFVTLDNAQASISDATVTTDGGVGSAIHAHGHGADANDTIVDHAHNLGNAPDSIASGDAIDGSPDGSLYATPAATGQPDDYSTMAHIPRWDRAAEKWALRSALETPGLSINGGLILSQDPGNYPSTPLQAGAFDAASPDGSTFVLTALPDSADAVSGLPLTTADDAGGDEDRIDTAYVGDFRTSDAAVDEAIRAAVDGLRAAGKVNTGESSAQRQTQVEQVGQPMDAIILARLDEQTEPALSAATGTVRQLEADQLHGNLGTPKVPGVPLGLLGLALPGFAGETWSSNLARLLRVDNSSTPATIKDSALPLDVHAAQSPAGGNNPPSGMNQVTLVYQFEALGVIGVLLLRSR